MQDEARQKIDAAEIDRLFDHLQARGVSAADAGGAEAHNNTSRYGCLPERHAKPARMTTSGWPAGLEISSTVAAALAQDGIETPTAVQRAAVEPLLAGHDAVLRSGTGTGKTLAYLLPLMQRLQQPDRRRLLVVAPSPELAVQILRTVERYKDPSLGSVGLIGGGSLERQKDRLKKGPRILVGTPGRVVEFIKLRKVKTAQIGTLVLDEADQILSPQIAAALADICSRPEFTAQIVCAAATEGEAAQAFVRGTMAPDLVRVDGDHAALRLKIDHHMVTWEGQPGGKDAVLLQVLAERGIERALIFVNKLYAVTHLYNHLTAHGIACLGLSGERNKQERAQALDALKTGRIRVLIATDTAARGLDIPQLDWVLHYEAGRDAATYLHRAGRVGRAGRSGQSLVLAARRDTYFLSQIAEELKIQFEAA